MTAAELRNGMKKPREYNYVYSLGVYVKTSWAWLKIDKKNQNLNSVFTHLTFKIQVQNLNVKFRLNIQFQI